jgi:hypothetical protein
MMDCCTCFFPFSQRTKLSFTNASLCAWSNLYQWQGKALDPSHPDIGDGDAIFIRVLSSDPHPEFVIEFTSPPSDLKFLALGTWLDSKSRIVTDPWELAMLMSTSHNFSWMDTFFSLLDGFPEEAAARCVKAMDYVNSIKKAEQGRPHPPSHANDCEGGGRPRP